MFLCHASNLAARRHWQPGTKHCNVLAGPRASQGCTRASVWAWPAAVRAQALALLLMRPSPWPTESAWATRPRPQSVAPLQVLHGPAILHSTASVYIVKDPGAWV